MEQKKRYLLFAGIAIGAIIILVGVVSAFGPLTNFLEMIETENDASSNPINASGSKVFSLESGAYDVYYYSTTYDDPGLITVIDPDGADVFSKSLFMGSSEMTFSNREYNKVGSFSADADGDYTVYIQNPGVVMVLDEMLVLENLLNIMLYVAVAIVGGVIVFISTLFLLIDYVSSNKNKN